MGAFLGVWVEVDGCDWADGGAWVDMEHRAAVLHLDASGLSRRWRGWIGIFK